MASSHSWLREFNEASSLADDINAMISERGSLPPSGPDTQRHSSATRRKITILGTRLDSLESLLSKLPLKQHMYMATLKVGDGNTDHYCWQRPEDMTTDRHAYRIDTNNTGLDLA